jgi:hypothetical protein
VTDSPQLAAVLLADVRRLGRRGRGLLRQFWFPLVLFGVLEMGSAALHGPALAAYWLAGGPLGGLACSWYYRRRERSTGYGWTHARGYAVLGGALFVSAWLAGALAPGPWHTAAPIVCAGIVFAGFAVLERSLLLGGFAAALGVAGLWLGFTGTSRGGAGATAVGAASVLVGLAYRARSRQLARGWR